MSLSLHAPIELGFVLGYNARPLGVLFCRSFCLLADPRGRTHGCSLVSVTPVQLLSSAHSDIIQYSAEDYSIYRAEV